MVRRLPNTACWLPCLEVNLYLLKNNALALQKLLLSYGIELNAVTKGVASNLKIVQALFQAGITTFSDSRVKTGKKIKTWARKNGFEVKVCLLRPPSKGEASEAAAYFDRFYVSDLRHAYLIDSQLGKAGRKAEVVLMVETGDSREGFLPEEIPEAVEKLKGLKNLKLTGFGTNSTCLHGKMPSAEDFELIFEMRDRFCPGGLASPGNSGALYLWKQGKLPRFEGELRIGEALLLGNETVTYEKLDFLSDEVFLLKTDVLEVRKKAYGKIQIVASLGIADIGRGHIYPLIQGIKEIKRSSDHTVFLIEEKEDEVLANLQNSDWTLSFKLTYFSLLQAFLSPTVNKKFIQGRY